MSVSWKYRVLVLLCRFTAGGVPATRLDAGGEESGVGAGDANEKAA
jgi:hypothetical protein